MKQELINEIEKLKELPEFLFKTDNNQKNSRLKHLKNQMQDELALAFGGSTSDGGYVLDGELWEASYQKQVKWLRSLHNKYKKLADMA